MRFNIRGCRVHVSFYFAAVVTMMLSADKQNLVFVSFLAAAFHEISHLLVYFFFHDIPLEVEFGVFGIRITQRNAAALSYRREMAVIAAGPLMNFILAAVLISGSFFCGNEKLTEAAGINLLLGLVNSLPIDPLDGGRFLFCLLADKTNALRAERIVTFCSAAVLLPLTSVGFYFSLFRGFNPTLLIMCVYLSALLIKRNH